VNERETSGIAFFIDADNFSAPHWIDEAFQILEISEGPIAIRRAYGSSDNLRGLADTLRNWAIRPFVNQSLSKNTTDLSLAVDAIELACQTPRPEVVVIGSGDVDFVPLVVRLRERGIRVLCVSERGKMAQDAVRAYDEVIYVGSIQTAGPKISKEELMTSLTIAPAQPASKKTAKKTAAKAASPKASPAKKIAAKKMEKKVVGTNGEKVTVRQILAAVPNLESGEWLRLGDVAKLLHDEKLLAKSATSTKLFKKYVHHFELMPSKQPNQVRFIRPPK
jgi:NYN domain